MLMCAMFMFMFMFMFIVSYRIRALIVHLHFTFHLELQWLERSGFFMGRHNASVLPLHQCCALRPPVEMIQTLVITYPAGIKAKETSFGRLPIHESATVV